MTDDVPELTVNTDEQRKQWIELLEIAVQYHNDMGVELGDDESIKFHNGISRAILESICLIQTWEIEERGDPYESTVKNISTDSTLYGKRDEFMEKVNK